MIPRPLTTVPDDYKTFQDLSSRVALTIEIPGEVVHDRLHKVLDIIHASVPGCLALLINNGLLDLAKLLRQILVSLAPTSQQADQRYQVPSAGKTTLLPACKWGSQVALVKYDFIIWDYMLKFVEKISQQLREEFKSVVAECQLVARTSLKVAVDAADSACRPKVTSTVMCRSSHLHSLGILKKVKLTIEDCAFQGCNSFNEKTDEALHSLKDLRAILRSLSVYSLPLRH